MNIEKKEYLIEQYEDRGYEYRVYVVGFVYNNDNAVVEIVDLYDTQWYS